MSTAIPQTMRYVKVTIPGPPEVMEVAAGPTPQPGAGEVLIRVAAAGVNRADVFQRMGKYRPPADASPILGLEVAGTIVTSGDNASHWQPGDAVCALVAGGGYAEFCIAPAAQCLGLPNGLSMIEAAGLPEALYTVWANVFVRGKLMPGESLLVHGGSSGIGTTAIQLAKALGSRVYVTAGSAEKCAACLKLGADAAINYREQDFAAEIRKTAGSQGVNVILDMVGAPYLEKNLSILAVEGRLVFIAFLQGSRQSVDLRSLTAKRLTITGSSLRPLPADEKASLARELHRHVWPLLEQGAVKPIIFQTFRLEEAAQAHRLMESSGHIGKIILTT